MGLKRFALWVDKPYQRDAILNPASPLNRDNCLSSFHRLAEKLAANGWECHTHDVYKAAGTCPDVVLFFEIPRLPVAMLFGGWRGKSRAWVVLQECEVIKPGNWNLANHGQFEKIFTWNKQLVDGKKYFRLEYANNFPETAAGHAFAGRRFCAMIAANKYRSHPLELYSERVRAIEWFEKNQPGEFDLFGIGWDRRCFGGPLRLLNLARSLTKLLAPARPSYRGAVAAKRPVLENYKFAICYENARGIPGYITEKIFDCFFAGVIPVYLGAPDIAEKVPARCFVDRRDFRTYEALYSYLKAMPESEADARLAAARAFLSSPESRPFTDKAYAEAVWAVLND